MSVLVQQVWELKSMEGRVGMEVTILACIYSIGKKGYLRMGVGEKGVSVRSISKVVLISRVDISCHPYSRLNQGLRILKPVRDPRQFCETS